VEEEEGTRKVEEVHQVEAALEVIGRFIGKYSFMLIS